MRLFWFFIIALSLGVSFYAAILLGDKEEMREDRPVLVSPVKEWDEIERRSINQITLFRKDQNIVFQKDSHGYWMITQPIQFLANQAKVHGMISSLTLPDTARILENPPKEYAEAEKKGYIIELASPKKKFKATLFDMPSHPRHFFIRFHHLDGVVHKLDDQLKPNLDLSLDEYRTKRLFPFPKEALTQISYQSEGIELGFDQKNEEWTCPQGKIRKHFEMILNTLNLATYQKTQLVGPDIGSPAKSTWKFNFQNGQEAICWLYILDKKILVSFNYHKNYFVVDAKTRELYFPHPDSLVVRSQ